MFFHLDFRHIFDIEFVYAYIFDICILDFYIFYTFVWDTYIIDTCVFDTYIFDPWFLRHQYFLDTYICWQLTTAKTEPEIRHLGYDKNTLNNATNHPLKGMVALWHMSRGTFWRRFRFSGPFLSSAPPNWSSAPILPCEQVEGVHLPAKMDGNAIGMILGWFLTRNSNFGFILVNWPPMAVIHPTYTPQTGWRGCKLPPKWMETQVVWFSGDFWRGIRISGSFWWINPLWRSSTFHIPLKQGGGMQVTAKMDENTSGMVLGWFLTRNSNFRCILVNRPPMAVIHPTFIPQTGWRGCKLPPKLMKTQSVWV